METKNKIYLIGAMILIIILLGGLLIKFNSSNTISNIEQEEDSNSNSIEVDYNNQSYNNESNLLQVSGDTLYFNMPFFLFTFLFLTVGFIFFKILVGTHSDF